MPDLVTVTTTILKYTAPKAWGKAKRSETALRIFKDLGLDPKIPSPSFDDIYTYTLVEYGVFKPKPILDFFRHNYIREAFRISFEQNRPAVLEEETEALLEVSPIGDALRELDVDPRTEFERFRSVFLSIAERTRTVTEIIEFQRFDIIETQLKDVHSQIQILINRIDPAPLVTSQPEDIPFQPPPAAAGNFYSLFIAYAEQDMEFAIKFHFDLENRGISCWFADEDMGGGKKRAEQIFSALGEHDKLLLILSLDSIKSQWIDTILHKALRLEQKQNAQKLFPITLVSWEDLLEWESIDSFGLDMAREVREYFIPDFINWKDHDAYQKAFDRLLRDLQAEDKT